MGVVWLVSGAAADAVDKKIDRVQVVNEPTVFVGNDLKEPIPVTGENEVDTTQTPSLYHGGPGRRTIAGPGCHDSGSGGPSGRVVIFRVFTGSVMACCTLHNLGDNDLEVNDSATGGIGAGESKTLCRSFFGDTWIAESTLQEGVGKFHWGADLLDVIDADGGVSCGGGAGHPEGRAFQGPKGRSNTPVAVGPGNVPVGTSRFTTAFPFGSVLLFPCYSNSAAASL